MKNVLQKATIASVGVVLAKVFFGGMSFKLGEHSLTVSSIDPGTIAALLTPTLGAFVTSLHDRFEDADGDSEQVPPKAKPEA